MGMTRAARPFTLSQARRDSMRCEWRLPHDRPHTREPVCAARFENEARTLGDQHHRNSCTGCVRRRGGGARQGRGRRARRARARARARRGRHHGLQDAPDGARRRAAAAEEDDDFELDLTPGSRPVDDRLARHVPLRDRPVPAAHRRRRDRAREARRARRPLGQGAHDQLEPAARRLDREALPRPRRAVPRPDPGRRHRPQPRGREVRLPQGVQVLDVRHVVDPPGLPALGREPVGDDPRARCTCRSASRSSAAPASASR